MLRGLITERDFAECDRAFPGIVHYYLELQDKPRTFLELVWSFTRCRCACSGSSESHEVASPQATAPVSQ